MQILQTGQNQIDSTVELEELMGLSYSHPFCVFKGDEISSFRPSNKSDCKEPSKRAFNSDETNEPDTQEPEFKIYEMKDFEILELIGCGSYSAVYKSKEKKTGKIYAVSQLRLSHNDEETEFISRIAQIRSKLYYPTILPLRGIIEQPPALISEYLPNYTAQYYIAKKEQQYQEVIPNWDLTHKMIIILGTSFGIEYLHSQNIVHRNIKPDNILLDSNFYPRINGFALAKDISESTTSTLCGTQAFMAPEVYTSGESCYDGKKADSYSFGMTIYSILLDRNPFCYYDNPFSIMKAVVSGERPEIEEGKISEKMKELIIKCWNQDPKKRPSFEEISIELLRETKRMIENREIGEEGEEAIRRFIRDFCKKEE